MPKNAKTGTAAGLLAIGRQHKTSRRLGYKKPSDSRPVAVLVVRSVNEFGVMSSPCPFAPASRGDGLVNVDQTTPLSLGNRPSRPARTMAEVLAWHFPGLLHPSTANGLKELRGAARPTLSDPPRF